MPPLIPLGHTDRFRMATGLIDVHDRRFTMQHLFQQIMKFGIVGVLAFVIDYGLMVALTEFAGMAPVASATISFIVSVVFNYLASMRFVFSHKEGMSKQREFLIFVALSVAGLLINDGLMWAGTEIASFDYRLVKIAATAVVMIWNFVTRKIFLDGRATSGSNVG